MDVEKIPGLIQWQPHTPRPGEAYCLNHLHPFELDHIMMVSDTQPGVTVKIHVAFSLHTFTRDIEAGDPHADRYSDNRETRCFCHERYAQSHRLPAIVRELPKSRKIFHSRTRSGMVNYATFETAEGKTYGVYFGVKRYGKRGPNIVLLTVVSAYVHRAAKKDTREGTIRFNLLLGRALRGLKPHPPPRAR
jgi:hypothetical protein